MISIFVAAQVAQLVVPPGPPWQPTPESVTRPGKSYRCRVFDRSGREGKLDFGRYGQRGYRDRSGTIGATSPSLKIDRDTLGVLSGYDFAGERYEGEHVILQFSRAGTKWEISSSDAGPYDHDYSRTKDYQVTINAGPLKNDIWGERLTQLVGFCDISYRQQAPLSENELSNYLKGGSVK